MDKDTSGAPEDCDNESCNLRKLAEHLLNEIDFEAAQSNEKKQDLMYLSQNRLHKYKDLVIHLPHIDENEVRQMYNALSPAEREFAKQGPDALSYAIDALDN